VSQSQPQGKARLNTKNRIMVIENRMDFMAFGVGFLLYNTIILFGYKIINRDDERNLVVVSR
jgi:hypothetical protein